MRPPWPTIWTTTSQASQSRHSPTAARIAFGKFINRNRLPVAAAAAVVVALGIGLGAALWQADQARQQADRARQQAEEARNQAERATALNTFVLVADPAF